MPAPTSESIRHALAEALERTASSRRHRVGVVYQVEQDAPWPVRVLSPLLSRLGFPTARRLCFMESDPQPVRMSAPIGIERALWTMNLSCFDAPALSRPASIVALKFYEEDDRQPSCHVLLPAAKLLAPGEGLTFLPGSILIELEGLESDYGPP